MKFLTLLLAHIWYGLIGAMLAIALPGAVAPARAQGTESAPTRSVRIATKELTDPDVAVSADGRWLVFTALGHLVQLSTTGGATKQLTSGPFYDSAPAISPDRTKVAFISDRKTTSQGNVFVLDIASGQIRQATDEFWVDRPVWSPDGKSLAFLSYRRIGLAGNYWFVGPGLLKSQIRRIRLADSKVETLTEPGFVHAVAFLTDGRPVWSVVEPETKGQPAISRLEVLSQRGEVTTALTVEGVVDRIAVDPGDAHGLYLRLYKTAAVSVVAPQPEHLAYVTLADGGPRTVTGLLSRPVDLTHTVEDRGAGARVYVAQLSNPLPRPAFGTAKGKIYLGDKGKLWSVDAATGQRDELTFPQISRSSSIPVHRHPSTRKSIQPRRRVS
jgi:dipeptidyl aminopeptidase/acylaminoacyl peptidase